MKKHLIDLQLFAEDDTPPAAGEPSGNEPKGTEPKEPAEHKGGADEKKYSDADVDKLINKKFAEWQQKKDKELDEAKKLANMNAQQKAEHERDKLQKELDEYKRKDSLAEMTKTARKMLADSGITIPDELLGMMVTTEAEQTKAAVDGFAKAWTEALESAVKERLKGEPPKKGTGTGAPSMTKAQIMEIKDPELRQKKMLENKHLFNF